MKCSGEFNDGSYGHVKRKKDDWKRGVSVNAAVVSSYEPYGEARGQ